MFRRLTPYAPLAAVACLLAGAAPAHAQTQPEIFVQNAEPVGAGNTVHLYGLPTRTADGKVAYWDTTLVLEAGVDGKPRSAVVSSVKSPKLKKTQFVPGTYQFGGLSCQLQASPFNGRTQYDLNCGVVVYTWYTGAIAGHPFETALRAAGLDSLVGGDEYAFGRVMAGGYSCHSVADLLTARQVGDILTLNNYGADDIIDCQINFTRSSTGQ
jgi:hypothetical protein